ncbi:MAG: hypothetical protein ABIH77_02290 [Pseudomonadota bacterium]|nr:hypothetical protein [Gammaproteobacteria bacterium]MBU1558607.1 hypothetical protein [Gammaproteobacteria bacterium]MBU1927059.1 hypothetical protein [Gammaproteobacteria bacterium]MBU2545872.1 hypothetical protein [Gammaproteobacteria bacterium]
MKDNEEFRLPLEEPRPILITIVCVLEFIYIVIGSLLLIFHPPLLKELVRLHGAIFPIAVFLFNIGTLIALYGIWRMKYWGAMLYILLFLLSGLYLHALDTDLFRASLPGMIVIFICVFYARKMKN